MEKRSTAIMLIGQFWLDSIRVHSSGSTSLQLISKLSRLVIKADPQLASTCARHCVRVSVVQLALQPDVR